MADATEVDNVRPGLAGCGEALTHLRVAVAGTSIGARYCGRLFAAHGAAVAAVPTADPDGDDGFHRWLREGTTPLASAADLAGPPDLLVVDGDGDGGGAHGGRAAVTADPGTVVLSVSWFAPDGPHRDLVGADEVVWAMSGLAFGIGDADGPPVLPQGCAPQLLCGLNAFTAGLAALLSPPANRPSTAQVDVHESVAVLAEPAGVRARAGAGTRPARLGVNRFGSTYPTTSYRSADGWVGLTCLTPAQWRSLCALIERPDLADDPRFVTSVARVRHADEVDAVVAPALARRSSQELVDAALASRLPLCPMPEPADLPRHAHWRDRQSFAPIDGGAGSGPTLPTRMAFTGRPIPRWGTDDRHGPLTGLRVADFTMGWAGPLATRLLADLGADVVKVEHQEHPDWWRGWDGPDGSDPPSIELQPHFNAMNRNKRGVCVDLRRPEGLEQARRLVAGADVVVDNFAAGVMDGLGLGADVQRQLNPDVISVSLPPFGSTGPLTALRAYGTTVEQSSGLPFVNGHGDWPPSLVHVALGDPVAGMYAGAAALVAIAARSHRGGSVVEVAQVECLFQLCAPHIIEASVGGRLARTGNHRRHHRLSCVAATGDGDWLYVALGDEAWRRLPGLLGPDGSVVGTGRPGDGDEAVAAWLRTRSTDHAATALRAIGAIAVVVRPQGHAGRDEQHDATGLWATLDRAHVGSHPMACPPFRLDGRRARLRRAAPLLGEHTTEVLAELARAGAA